jgi:hypothetical protein
MWMRKLTSNTYEVCSAGTDRLTFFANQVLVHKAILLFFTLKLKYEISAHSWKTAWRKQKKGIGTDVQIA